jgi:hypothetical protein
VGIGPLLVHFGGTNQAALTAAIPVAVGLICSLRALSDLQIQPEGSGVGLVRCRAVLLVSFLPICACVYLFLDRPEVISYRAQLEKL